MSARRQAVKPVMALALVSADMGLMTEHDLLEAEGFVLSTAVKLRYSRQMITLALIWVRPGARHEVALQFRRAGCPDFRAADFCPALHPHQRIFNHFETVDFGVAAPAPPTPVPSPQGGGGPNAEGAA